MRSLPLLFLTSILATTACGGDDGGGGDVPLDQFATRFAATSCKNIFKCCDATERMQQFQIFNPMPTNEAECTQTLAALIMSFGINTEAITAGRLVYDGAAAADCLAAVDAAACGAATHQAEDNGSCTAFFVGQVAAGGQCKDDAECAVAGSFCSGGSSDTFGACTTLPALGQPCDGECVAGAFCDGTMCAAKKANGTACGFNSECTSDHCDTTCMADNSCDGV
jgi:hypothetical protein